jgi:hypothetical protein
MIRREVTRMLPVPLTEGFDYITDVRNWRSYWPGLVDVRDVDNVSWSKPGDEAAVVVRVRGRPVDMRLKLERFDPYASVVYTSAQEGLPDLHHERHFKDRDGMLDYTSAVAFAPRRGLGGLSDRVFVARALRRSLVETVDSLERVFRSRTLGARPEER